MQRVRNYNDGAGPKRVTLISELQAQKLYRLEGNGPYVYRGVEEGSYIFVHTDDSQVREVSRDELEKMISNNAVVELRDESFAEVTVPEYPYLDRFTNSMFVTPTADLYDRTGIYDTFSRSELLELNDLCQERDMTDMPTPGDNDYMSLVQDPRWPILKKYILFFSPDTELPEQFA